MTRTKKISKLVGFLVLSVLLLGFPLGTIRTSAVEVSNEPTSEGPLSQDVRYLQWPAKEGIKQEPLLIVSGTSQSLRFDRPVVRASISDPTICDITTLNRQEILVNAKKSGHVNLLVWDEQNHIASFHIQSTIDVEQLEQILHRLDPKAKFNIYPFEGSVVVQGSTDTVLKAKQMEQAIAAFDPKATSLVQVKKPKQILLEVRFAEVNRKAAKDFGLDTQAIVKKWSESTFFGRNSPPTAIGDTTGTQNFFTPKGATVGIPFLPTPRSSGTTDAFFTYGTSDTWVSSYLQWLAQQNILKIIARPNLLAKDGEEAKFLVGGEFPVPVENANTITVDYKQFGTKLEFKPEVLDDDVLRLKVLTEVSELDFSTTVSFRSNVLPTILKRSQETVAELKDGQALVIGGMITQRINKVTKKFPVLGDIPLLSRGFRRDEFARTDVELLIVVTPHIVSPFDMGEKKDLFSKLAVTQIQDASRVYKAPYPDDQGDMINEVLTQGETLQNFERPGETVQHIAPPKEEPKEHGQKIEVGHDKVQVNVQIDVKDNTTPKQVQQS